MAHINKTVTDNPIILNAGASSEFTTTTGTLTFSGPNVVITGTGGTLLIDTTGILELNSSGGVISIGNDVIAQNINIGTGGTRIITIGSGTGSTSLVLSAGTGNIDIGTENFARTTNIATGTAVQVVTLGSTNGASSTTIQSGTGNLSLLTTGATADIIIDSDNILTIDADGILELNSSGGIISIGNDNNAFNINIGNGSAARIITIGNDTDATSIVLNAGTGAVNIGSNATAHATTVGSVTTTSTTTLQSGTGGLSLTSTGTSDTAIHLNANDTAAGMTLEAGTAGVIIVSPSGLRIREPDAGAEYVQITTPELSASWTLTLPPDNGNAGDVWTTVSGDGVATWVAPAGGGGGSGITTFEASDFLSSTESGWSITELAPSIVDPTLNMVHVRAFDGAGADEAVGLQYYVPSGTTSLDITLVWRKSTSAAGDVDWSLYSREFITGAAITADAWTTTNIIATNDPGSNQNLVRVTTNFTVGALDITADNLAYFQLVRLSSVDSYAADAYVLSLSIEAS